MPLEINEIAVRLRVGDGQPDQGDEASDQGIAAALAETKESIIDECLHRVLRALKLSRGR